MITATFRSYVRLSAPRNMGSSLLTTFASNNGAVARSPKTYLSSHVLTRISERNAKFRYFSTDKNTDDSSLIPELPLLTFISRLAITDQVTKMVQTESPYLVVCLHGFRTNAALLKFLIDTLKFKKERVFVADKFYSTSPQWERMMRELGVNYYKVPTPDILGGYGNVFTHTLKNMWGFIKQQIFHDNEAARKIKIIVLSDGGDLLNLTPPDLRVLKIAGVEQTTVGLKKIDTVLYPVIEVASSAGKKKLESLLIAEDLFLHINPYLANEHSPANKTCGVIGNGIIGTALAKHLLKLGFNIWVYDKHPHAFDKVKSNVIVCDSVRALLDNCDYAFGCTGENIFTHNGIDAENFLLTREKDLTFFSCSSSMIEWEDIIYTVRKNTDIGKGRLVIPPMSDLTYVTPKNTTVMVTNMGYPINFNRQEESVPMDSIAYTRSLMAIGAMQACLKARTPFADGYTINRPERVALDATLQKVVTHQWLKTQPAQRFSDDLVKNFQDEAWIAENSQLRREHSPLPPITRNWYIISSTRF